VLCYSCKQKNEKSDNNNIISVKKAEVGEHGEANPKRTPILFLKKQKNEKAPKNSQHFIRSCNRGTLNVER
jgi:hypothetical protein